MNKPKLGTGERFQKLETSLAEKPGVRSPAALAAAIGRRLHGASQMAKWSASGRKEGE